MRHELKDKNRTTLNAVQTWISARCGIGTLLMYAERDCDIKVTYFVCRQSPAYHTKTCE